MIAIIDYNAGNLTSVARAVAHLGFSGHITCEAEEIRRSERIIFPGVGAAGAAMESLRATGLDAVIQEQFAAGKPILGICLGTQVIMAYSEENDTTCLGILAGRVGGFPVPLQDSSGRRLKIPHMGWNRIHIQRPHPMLAGLSQEDEFYFVHSYYPTPENPDCILACSDYGVTFASVVGYRNLVATQFHLEKSGRPGLRMLKNFCEWDPLG
jgi:imidazole glycerol-phosphate synthase subunit HisH